MFKKEEEKKNPLSSIKSKQTDALKNKENENKAKNSENTEEKLNNNEKKEIISDNKENDINNDTKNNSDNVLEEENKKLKESLMRTLAELDNTRRRSIEENEKTAKYAIGKFAEDLIPVMENFYLAFNSIDGKNICDDKVANGFLEGIKLTQNELKKVFDKHGLARIFPENEDFNPDLHNAITQVESDKDDGKIVEVMQAGYKIKDRLLRPALVVVSKKK